MLLFAKCPRASFMLAPLGLKETEMTATQTKVVPVPRQGTHLFASAQIKSYVHTSVMPENRPSLNGALEN